jgi:hypothetical protein
MIDDAAAASATSIALIIINALSLNLLYHLSGSTSCSRKKEFCGSWIFSQNLRRGIAASKLSIFGVTPA